MKIKLERSGGIAGMSSSNELDFNNFPPAIQIVIRQLLDNKKLSLLRGSKPKGAADYFTYRIVIQEGKKDLIIEANEFNMNSNLKKLVRYLQKNPK